MKTNTVAQRRKSGPPHHLRRRRVWTIVLGLGALGATGAVPTRADAKPSGPIRFCEAYSSSPECTGRLITCDICHTSTDPPLWNDYGAAVLTELAGQPFDDNLASALARIEDLDTDGDGADNLEEILVGTNPGNAESWWQPVPTTEDNENPWYALGAYDPSLAYRRASVLYCGHSPRYEDLQALHTQSDTAQRETIHQALATCLDSQYWRGPGQSELADPRIKPNYAVGPDTEVEFSGVRLVLADYEWDYRLWRYILSDDRDLRELLTAQYHVEQDSEGRLIPIEGPISTTHASGGGGQPLVDEYRAGMITTQWFLMSNTMFSQLPRTTAAQAYRAYLGMDISNNEGIVPVAGEPLDIDEKGVGAPSCAQCHSTLDPLAYAFSYYTGLDGDQTGQFDPERPTRRIPDWDALKPQAMVLGQPVDSVVEWAKVVSESSYFRYAMVRMFFEHALGRAPGPGEYDDLEAVIATVVDDGFSANRIIHRIVDTQAFGAP